MKSLSTNDNYIPQLITLGYIMIFSLAIRSIALHCGADGFTAFGLFILSSLISTVLFLAIRSITRPFSPFNQVPKRRKDSGGVRHFSQYSVIKL